MKRFSKIVRRQLRANKRTKRPSWSPVEDPFEDRKPEAIDLSDILVGDPTEERR